MKLFRVVRLWVAAISAVVAGAGTVHAEPAVGVGARYVALGSSYGAGPDIAPIVDTACTRSGANYPHLVAERLGLDLADVTCGGATTADILSRSQRLVLSNVSVPRQIDAVTSDTSLVTLTIGGNDLGYVSYLTQGSCVAKQALPNPPVDPAVTDGLCSVTGGPKEPAPDAYDTVRDSIADIVTEVHARAPRAKVVLVQYLPALGPDAATCPSAPLTSERAAATVRIYDGLVRATAAAAARTGAIVVTPSEVAAGHTVCSADPWITGYKFPPIGAKPTPYHPNAAGMTALAQLVLAQL